MGGDVGSGLRNVLYTQTKLIIEEFHQQRLQQVRHVLEQEKWERTDVPVAYHQILERLVGKKQPALSGSQEIERFLRVEGINFLVVPAALTLMQVLSEYVQLCQDLTSLSGEILQRMVHLLRLFNQQAQKLMLGGQSVQRQLLKRITAANLALCSQCCALVSHVLPKLQSNLLDVLRGPKDSLEVSTASSASRSVGAALLQELSGISGDYDEHRSLLFGKLSDLLRESYEVHAKRWFSSPHHEFQPQLNPLEEGNAQHDALEGLAKDIMTMYKVLLKNLSGENVRTIFGEAFDEISRRFERRLAQDLNTPSPPYEDKLGCSLGDRLAMDIAFLNEQLGKLSHISIPLQQLLLALVQHIQVKLSAENPLKRLHPAALEALQRTGRVPS